VPHPQPPAGPGYHVRLQTLCIAGREFQLESLLDKQQFDDPGQAAEQLGVSPAQWSLFGNLWPAAFVLAEAMATIDFRGRRVLEVGAGLGLASLVAQSRGADITASDIHPLRERFLAGNTARNQLPPIPFHRGGWAEADADLGRFALIVASEVLYEGGHAGLLSEFIARHAEPAAEVLMVDPGRGQQNHFARAMVLHGFAYRFEQLAARTTPAGKFAGKIHTFRREP
jgi:ETFB lysine methyltransferase